MRKRRIYKGYEVVKEIIHDYEYPKTALVVIAPCGCQACEDKVQEGHFACFTSPEDLRSDPNVYPRLEESRWFWEYIGSLAELEDPHAEKSSCVE